MWDFPLFPDQASTFAQQVDRLYFVLVGLGAFFGIGVAVVLLYFAAKYRHRADVDRSNPVTESVRIEMAWIVVPLVLSMGVFVWAAAVYVELKGPAPADAIEVYATAKQWMWKFQHPNGAREINTLHVPAGRPVKMIMASQDVIHSFFVPAFRVKQDVLPGRYVDIWFQATRPGKYHLFCAEYCGADHSYMGGYVYVMEPVDYEAWLRLGETGGSDATPGTGRFERAPFSPGYPGAAPEREAARAPAQTMAAAGAALFRQLRCDACHRVDSTALSPSLGPVLYGVYGSPVRLQNERTIIADEQYLRESILYPQAKLVAGYPAIMPTYKRQVSEDELGQLVAYLKSLGAAGRPAPIEAPDTVAVSPAPAPGEGKILRK